MRSKIGRSALVVEVSKTDRLRTFSRIMFKN